MYTNIQVDYVIIQNPIKTIIIAYVSYLRFIYIGKFKNFNR